METREIHPGKQPPPQKRGPGLDEKFSHALRRFSLKPGDKVLVAVSGGPDSLCLLHLLKSHFPEAPLSLHVAHLNHGLRPEAAEEARFVETLCGAWGLPFTSAARPLVDRPKKPGTSIQAAARELRYRFLRETAQEVGAPWIALGHTADDQAETVLMRLLRGAGPEGLSGIPERRAGGIIRPLLKATREEILARLAREKIDYIEDPSNRKPLYERNRIRHGLLPVLEQYNPRIKAALCREAALLRDENDFVHRAMAALLPALKLERNARESTLDFETLRTAHPALQRRVLRWIFEQWPEVGKNIDFEAIEALRLAIVSGFKEKERSLPRGITAEKRGRKLYLNLKGDARRTRKRRIGDDRLGGNENGHPVHSSPESTPIELGPAFSAPPAETRIALPEWGLVLTISLKSGPPEALSACIASFDFDKLPFPLFLRKWKVGDRFAPLGMGGKHKKLQDFFVDAKIPRTERRQWPILACPEGVLWVMNLRVDARFCATRDTLRTLSMAVQANADYKEQLG